MRISVFGLGYVGSVSAVCLAELGHEVIGIDIIAQKIERLQQGEAPVKEPDLDELLQKNLKTDRLSFTTDTRQAVECSEVAMITVGTPSDENGNVNLGALERCIEDIAYALTKYNKEHYSIVIRSTIPPGTTRRMEKVVNGILEKHAKAGDPICEVSFSMNPEFTREGAAVKDFLYPALIVFGTDRGTDRPVLEDIYRGIEATTIWVNSATSELVKYTNNAFHALKVAFANEIGRIADHYDVDGKAVMEILCADKKLNISAKYLRPGFAFGGSCLPKDLRGITAIAKQKAVQVPVLESILKSNDLHIKHHEAKINHTNPQKIGILGIAFKAQTDDLRESPGLRLVCSLIEQGFPVKMTDAHLTPTYLMGRNKQYINSLLPSWENYYTIDVQSIFDFADTIIVTNTEKIYQDWITQLKGDHQIILLN